MTEVANGLVAHMIAEGTMNNKHEFSITALTSGTRYPRSHIQFALGYLVFAAKSVGVTNAPVDQAKFFVKSAASRQSTSVDPIDNQSQ